MRIHSRIIEGRHSNKAKHVEVVCMHTVVKKVSKSCGAVRRATCAHQLGAIEKYCRVDPPDIDGEQSEDSEGDKLS